MTRARSQIGFTLLETIIVVAIVGVLIVLAVPGLDRARRSGNQTADLSALRSHVTVFTSYATDSRDQWPCFADPAASYSVVRNDRFGVALQIYYFEQHLSWYVALADGYYDGYPNLRVFAPTIQRKSSAGVPFDLSYEYSCAFVARPVYWNPRSRDPSVNQRGSTRVDEVVHTAKKVLLFDPSFVMKTAVTGDRIPADYRPTCAFPDGSSRAIDERQYIPGYPNGDGVPQSPFQGHVVAFPYPHHTLDGVRGRDLP